MSVNNLIEPITASGGKVTLENAQRWMQGRTLYGGASALIAYTAAIRAFPDLPPFRAGQVSFIAPIGNELELRSTIIRQGRNITHLRSDIMCDGNLALTAFWLFGSERETNAHYSGTTSSPKMGNPEQLLPIAQARAPNFIKNNCDIRYTPERQKPGEALIRRWLRLKEPSGVDPVSELILMGDMLPPSAARLMQRPGPLSSINWSFNMLDTAPQTRGGWWLAEIASDHADQGYSSERLRLWNADGKQMLAGIQAVAIFG